MFSTKFSLTVNNSLSSLSLLLHIMVLLLHSSFIVPKEDAFWSHCGVTVMLVVQSGYENTLRHTPLLLLVTDNMFPSLQ